MKLRFYIAAYRTCSSPPSLEVTLHQIIHRDRDPVSREPGTINLIFTPECVDEIHQAFVNQTEFEMPFIKLTRER